jgi:hypothetical protein
VGTATNAGPSKADALNKVKISEGLGALLSSARGKALGNHATLELLADHLRGKGSSTVPWHQVDLPATLADPEQPLLSTVGKRSRGTAGLERVLSAAVFLPLLITWIGLALAARAYGKLAENDPRMAGQPFLQQWQSGFGGELPEWATFEHVAQSAIAAIGALLLLAAVAAVRRHLEDRDEERVREQLVPLLARAQIALARDNSSDPSTFARTLNSTAQELRDLVSSTRTTADALKKAADDMRTAAVGVSSGSKQLKEAADPIKVAVDRAERAMSGSTDRLEQSLIGMSDRLHGTVRKVEENLGDLADAQRGFTTGLEVAADQIGRKLGTVSLDGQESVNGNDASTRIVPLPGARAGASAGGPNGGGPNGGGPNGRPSAPINPTAPTIEVGTIPTPPTRIFTTPLPNPGSTATATATANLPTDPDLPLRDPAQLTDPTALMDPTDSTGPTDSGAPTDAIGPTDATSRTDPSGPQDTRGRP